jgi:hypothetical protein
VDPGLLAVLASQLPLAPAGDKQWEDFVHGRVGMDERCGTAYFLRLNSTILTSRHRLTV